MTTDPIGLAGEAYRDALVAKLTARTGCREEARDLAQEAYLRYLSIKNREGIRNPGGYIFRIAANLFHEWRLRRRLGAQVVYDSPLAEKQGDVWPDPSPHVSEQLTTEEHLTRVLEQIPLTYRRVLIWSRWDGLTNEEIGEKLKITPDSVRRYLVRAAAFARRAQWD